MDKKSIMSKRIFDIEKEVNLAVLGENWFYFEWFNDIEYITQNKEFRGVKIKLTSEVFHPVQVYIDTEEKLFKAYYKNIEITYRASEYVCEMINSLYLRKYCIDRSEN